MKKVKLKRPCRDCGNRFQPKGNHYRFCEECRKKRHFLGRRGEPRKSVLDKSLENIKG